MRWRLLRWCWVSVLGCTLSAPAEGNISADSDEERARIARREANIAILEGRKKDAVERFRAAWGYFKNPVLKCELGALEADMGAPREAAQDLTLCLRLLKPEHKRVIGSKAERILKKARAQVGELTVQANVPDAEVVVDGAVIGTLPMPDPIFLDPGSHGVEVRAPGYHSDARLAVMLAGRSMWIRMRLEPMRAEVAPPPLERAPLEPKKEEDNAPLEPKKEDSSPLPPVSAESPVLLPAPGRGAELPQQEPVRAAVILTGLGLSVAGTAAGVGGLMAAAATSDEAKSEYRKLTTSMRCGAQAPDPCSDVDDTVDDALAFTALGVAGLAMSAVGGALVVYELVRPPVGGKVPGAQVAFMPAPGGGMLHLTGAF